MSTDTDRMAALRDDACAVIELLMRMQLAAGKLDRPRSEHRALALNKLTHAQLDVSAALRLLDDD